MFFLVRFSSFLYVFNSVILYFFDRRSKYSFLQLTHRSATLASIFPGMFFKFPLQNWVRPSSWWKMEYRHSVIIKDFPTKMRRVGSIIKFLVGIKKNLWIKWHQGAWGLVLIMIATQTRHFLLSYLHWHMYYVGYKTFKTHIRVCFLSLCMACFKHTHTHTHIYICVYIYIYVHI